MSNKMTAVLITVIVIVFLTVLAYFAFKSDSIIKGEYDQVLAIKCPAVVLSVGDREGFGRERMPVITVKNADGTIMTLENWSFRSIKAGDTLK